MFTFDEFWSSLGTSIFQNSISAVNITGSRLPSRLSISYDYVDINVYDNLALWFHLFGIWLSVKYRNFLVINNFLQVIQVFILLYKEKFKVQHENATCLLCNIVFHFYVARFVEIF